MPTVAIDRVESKAKRSDISISKLEEIDEDYWHQWTREFDAV